MKTNTKKLLAAALTLTILGGIGLSLTQSEWLKGRFTSRPTTVVTSVEDAATQIESYLEQALNQKSTAEAAADDADQAKENGDADALATAQEAAENAATAAQSAATNAATTFDRAQVLFEQTSDEVSSAQTTMENAEASYKAVVYARDVAKADWEILVFLNTLDDDDDQLAAYSDFTDCAESDVGNYDADINYTLNSTACLNTFEENTNWNTHYAAVTATGFTSTGTIGEAKTSYETLNSSMASYSSNYEQSITDYGNIRTEYAEESNLMSSAEENLAAAETAAEAAKASASYAAGLSTTSTPSDEEPEDDVNLDDLSNAELAEMANEEYVYAEAYADRAQILSVTATNAYEAGEAETLASTQTDIVEKAAEATASAESAGAYADELFSRYEEQAQKELDEILSEITDLEAYVTDLSERYSSVLEEYGLALEEYDDFISIEKPDYERSDAPIFTETELYETYATEYEEYIESYVELTFVLESMADEEAISDYLESMGTYESIRSEIVEGFAGATSSDDFDLFIDLSEEIIETKLEISGTRISRSFFASFFENLSTNILKVELASEDSAEIILGYYMSANEDYLGALSYAQIAQDAASYVLSLNLTSASDPDNDGLTNDEEATLGTDPNDDDTDGDTLNDGDEVYTFFTDPLDTDSDDDGWSDFSELEFEGTDPNDFDTDNDNLGDYDEAEGTHGYVTDPLDSDTDNGSTLDGAEITAGTNPQDPSDDIAAPADTDADDDGLSDTDEATYGTDPNDWDSDDDGLNDYDEIFKYKTDPLDSDTDNDGMGDGTEVSLGTDPLVDSTTPVSTTTTTTTTTTLTDDDYVCDEPFVDVLDSDWHEEIVCRMFVADVVNGREEDLFEPNDTLTRAEAIKIISILLLDEEEEDGEDLTEDFDDVLYNDWFRDFIAIAQDANVIRVNDFGDYFYPNEPISRGDLALYTVRALDLTSYSFDIDYTDVDRDAYYAYAIAILSDSETDVPYDETEDEVPVISGYEDSSFRPTSNITRAEALAMIYRAYLAYIAD